MLYLPSSRVIPTTLITQEGKEASRAHLTLSGQDQRLLMEWGTSQNCSQAIGYLTTICTSHLIVVSNPLPITEYRQGLGEVQERTRINEDTLQAAGARMEEFDNSLQTEVNSPLPEGWIFLPLLHTCQLRHREFWSLPKITGRVSDRARKWSLDFYSNKKVTYSINLCFAHAFHTCTNWEIGTKRIYPELHNASVPEPEARPVSSL